MNNLGLGILISAKDAASGVLNKVSGSFSEMEGAANSAAKAVATAGKQTALGAGIFAAGAGILAGAFHFATGESAAFEQHLTDIRSRTGASAEEMTRLADAAKDGSYALMGISSVDAAEALKALTVEGYNTERSIAALNGTLEFAKITQQSAAQAAGAFADILDVYKVDVADSTLAVDKMAYAMARFGIDGAEMTPMMLGIADAAKLTDTGFNDMLSTLSIVKSVIPNVGRATMATRQALMQLADDNIQKKLKGLNIVVKDPNTKQLKKLPEVLAEITEKTNKMSEAQRTNTITNIFGGRAAGGMSTIIEALGNGIEGADGKIRKGTEALKELNEALDASGGNAKNQIDIQMSTLGGQLTILQTQFKNMNREIGDAFAPTFAPIVKGLVKAMQSVSEWVKNLPPGFKQGIGKIVVSLGALLAGFGAFVAFKGSLALLGFALSAIGVSVGGIVTALAPLALAFGGILLLVKALQVHSDQTGAGVIQTFAEMGRKVSLFGQALGQLFSDGGFSGQVREELGKAENQGVKGFAIQVFVWVERIRNFFRGLATGFEETVRALKPHFDLFVQALKSLGEAFGITLSPAKDNKSAWEAAGSAGAQVGSILAGVAAILSDVVAVSLSVVAEAVEWVKIAWNTLAPVVTAVAGVIVGVVEFLEGLFTGNWAQMWDGAVDLVLGAADTIISTVMGMARAVVGVIDRLGASFGKDWKLGEKLDAFTRDFKADLRISADSLKTGEGAIALADNISAAGESVVSAPSAFASALTPAWNESMNGARAAVGLPVKHDEDWYAARIRDLNSRASVSSPAVSSQQASAQRAEQYDAAIRSLIERAQKDGVDTKELTINVPLHIDGTKIAQAVTKTKMDRSRVGFRRTEESEDIL